MNSVICTHTGVRFNPFSPAVEDVRIDDIAHALAAVPRFAGHTYRPYSVAQHSWSVSLRLRGIDAAYGLLHDAAEAYLGDVPTPLKSRLEITQAATGYRISFEQAEHNLLAVIFQRFGLDPTRARDLPLAVRQADAAALFEERDSLMPEVPWWPMRTAPRDLMPQPAEKAKALFLNAFDALVRQGHLKD